MITVYVTFPNQEEARKICAHLVEMRLVACANMFKEHDAFYWWEGKVQEGQEIAALLKTRADLFVQVEAEIKKLHSYEVPCIVAWPIDRGHAPFMEWIFQETQGDGE